LLLARKDTDPFARWEAINGLMTDSLVAAFRARLGGKLPDFSRSILDLPGEIAADETLEPAYRALAITLPSETDIAREIGSNIDPDAVHSARQALTTAIGKHHGSNLQALYGDLDDGQPFRPDAASAGRRALRNVLLDYICAADGAPDRATRQFDEADNMTDRFAALGLLVHRFAGTVQAKAALEAFEARYERNPLVMDKWFQVQATAPGDETLDTVRRLTSHPAYSWTNPNRVRALIGTFANSNQTGFHRRDGEGYRFFAETVLRLDEANPQLAARLATAMRSWRSLEPERQAAARSSLLTISTAAGLSRDLRDIVERTLA
jgi:aminopeptidase N